MKCATCSGALPVQARFCPTCGTLVGGPAATKGPFTVDDFRDLEKTGEKPSSLPCPRCEAPLTEAHYGDLKVEECFACEGAWYDRKELQAFMARYRKRKEETEGPPLAGKLQRYTHDGKVVYLNCPRCGRMMSRQNFGRLSGVIIDQCPEDGLWLDGGELEKLVAFVQSGGLVAGERRKLDEMKRRARDAEHRADIADRTARRMRGHWIGPAIFWDVW